jgi:hypothetical protein
MMMTERGGGSVSEDFCWRVTQCSNEEQFDVFLGRLFIKYHVV